MSSSLAVPAFEPPANAPVELSHVRRELMVYLDELATEDPRLIWQQERKEGLISGIDQVVHYFFDDHDFDEQSIGLVLLNRSEVAAIQALKSALDLVLTAVGVRALRLHPDDSDDKFVRHPLWAGVTKAADSARKQLSAKC